MSIATEVYLVSNKAFVNSHYFVMGKKLPDKIRPCSELQISLRCLHSKATIPTLTGEWQGSMNGKDHSSPAQAGNWERVKRKCSSRCLELAHDWVQFEPDAIMGSGDAGSRSDSSQASSDPSLPHPQSTLGCCFFCKVSVGYSQGRSDQQHFCSDVHSVVSMLSTAPPKSCRHHSVDRSQ